MPVVAPIVLSVIVAEPSFSTEAPTLKPVMATLSAERLAPLTSIAVDESAPSKVTPDIVTAAPLAISISLPL